MHSCQTVAFLVAALVTGSLTGSGASDSPSPLVRPSFAPFLVSIADFSDTPACDPTITDGLDLRYSHLNACSIPPPSLIPSAEEFRISARETRSLEFDVLESFLLARH